MAAGQREVKTVGTLNPQSFFEMLARIVSEREGVSVSVTVKPRNETAEKTA